MWRKVSHKALELTTRRHSLPKMDVIKFRYLVSLVVSKGLEMQLIDVVTAYLHGDLDSEIYKKVHDGLTLPKSSDSNP